MTATEGQKKRVVALIGEIDAVELGVQLFEAVVGIKRPEGLTAQQAFDLLPSDDKARVLRAARVGSEYVAAAISNGRQPS